MRVKRDPRPEQLAHLRTLPGITDSRLFHPGPPFLTAAVMPVSGWIGIRRGDNSLTKQPFERPCMSYRVRAVAHWKTTSPSIVLYQPGDEHPVTFRLAVVEGSAGRCVLCYGLPSASFAVEFVGHRTKPAAWGGSKLSRNVRVWLTTRDNEISNAND